ncbi:hypothetical protein niasHS_010004 [Heterodera schachtii]|uniref:Peptidase S1 domain-containing protein n=1 Tax=Heterodera schachtii TaxID=97005 RepID=A0ABD2JDK5_HETSC
MVFTGNNLYSICAHKVNFSQCGISDFEPDLDNVPNVKIGTNHIYKGRPVENANSMPWMVTLNSLQGLCTGTIISHKYILTAYHCVSGIISVPSSVHISYGTVNISNEKHKTIGRNILIHPNASLSEMRVKIYGKEIESDSLSNDLAIIEVENAIKFSQNVRPICLFGLDAPSHSKVSGKDKFGTFSATNNSPFIVAGWGLTQPMCQKYPAPKQSAQLMVGKMRMISMEECIEYTTKDINNEFNNLSNALPFVKNTRALLTEFNSAYLKDKFCVVAEPSLAEKGDSGGPLMRKIGKNNWVQVGVASTSMCSPEKPESTDGLTSEYTQIDCNWIEEATNGENFIENRLAAKILFIPTIGLGGITPTMFFTGIDRLIGIAFSEIHDKLKTRLYLAMITVISVSYGFLFSVVSYQRAKQDGDLMVTGSYTDVLRVISLFVTISNLFTLMTLAIYIFLGIVIHMKASGLPSADSFNRRTFRALFCIITVNIGGYFITTIVYFLIIPISSPVTHWFCALMTAIPMNIAALSNGPILYFTSTEYRQAFQKEFPFVFKQTPNQNQISCDAAMDDVAHFAGTFAAKEQQVLRNEGANGSRKPILAEAIDKILSNGKCHTRKGMA